MTITFTGWGGFWIFLAVYVACEWRLYENGLESILTHSLIRKKKEEHHHKPHHHHKEPHKEEVKVVINEAPSIPPKKGRGRPKKMDKAEVIINVHE